MIFRISPSAACGRNEVEGFGWPCAVSRQRSAISLVFSADFRSNRLRHYTSLAMDYADHTDGRRQSAAKRL